MSLRIAIALAAAAFAFSAGANPPETPDVSARMTSEDDPATRVDRVVVAPLNLTVRAPAELEGKDAPVWQELLRYFQQRDRQVAVLNPISAERLWLEATKDLDLSDRQAALRTGHARLAEELARHRAFDVLVVPSLVLRPAYLNGWHASWDGVQRMVPNAATEIYPAMGDVGRPGEFEIKGLRGKVVAASLHVTLLGPDGREIFQGLGGLDVLQEAHRDAVWETTFSFVERSDPFSDAEAVRDGVERAFDGPALVSARGW